MTTALTYSAKDFSEAQARLGLNDDELGCLLYRGDIGAAAVRDFASGVRPIPQVIAFAMCGLERGYAGERCAA